MFSLEKHLEVEDPFSSGFLCLDCCFGKILENWQFKKNEDLNIGLVWYVQVQWWVSWLSFSSLSVAMDLWSMVLGLFRVSWIMPQYLTSSYFSLELYWIGCLLYETNHSLLFLFFLILVIFVPDLWPLYTSCVQGCPFFFINKTYYL